MEQNYEFLQVTGFKFEPSYYLIIFSIRIQVAPSSMRSQNSGEKSHRCIVNDVMLVSLR